jgi:predicted ATPase
VVEEPEAYLFPVAQKQIIDLIALLANQNENQVIVTTHSPYILSSFNNLLYAYIPIPDEFGESISINPLRCLEWFSIFI